MKKFLLLVVLSLLDSLLADVLEELIRSSFPRSKKCLHVLTDKNHHYDSTLKIFHSNSYPMINTVGMTSGEGFGAIHCDDYISECKDVDELLVHIEFLKKLTKEKKNHKKMRFLIFVHEAKDIVIETKDLNLNILIIRKFINLSISISGFPNNTFGEKPGIYNLVAPLINKTILMSSRNYLINPSMIHDLFHEQKVLLNIRVVNNRTFRVSLFECPPFVIYGKDKMDGIEYRIIREVAKNWKLETLRRDFSENISDPWSVVKEDVAGNRSDLAMCSIWLTSINQSEMDFSQEYNSLCATFLVPKPTLMSPSKYLTLPLNIIVWIGLMISVIITMTWLYIGASADKLSENTSPYSSIVYCLMRVIEMTTLHGLNSIPRPMSFKIIITFWMITCILRMYFIIGFFKSLIAKRRKVLTAIRALTAGHFNIETKSKFDSSFFLSSYISNPSELKVSTAYSSGYTSLLTCPQYSRKIETLKDMVNEGVYWGEILNNSIESTNQNVYLVKISQRRKQLKNLQELIRNIEKGNYATFVKRLGDDYVTDTERYQNVSKHLSCLKECIAQYYIVFALQKNSYYKDIINKRLIELLESGIVRFWQTDIIRKYKTNYMKDFFADYKNAKSEPFSLSISHTRGAFYLLASGLFLAKIIFINEVFGIIRFHRVRLPIGDVEYDP